jgi:hypothetical protein
MRCPTTELYLHAGKKAKESVAWKLAATRRHGRGSLS